MSTGLVICSACRREVHEGTAGWHHCADGSPRCAGASSAYPQRRDEVVGPCCQRDGPLPDDDEPDPGESPAALRERLVATLLGAGVRTRAEAERIVDAAPAPPPPGTPRPSPPRRPGSNLPVGATWLRHEKAGSRAATRRLRQMAKGQIRPGLDRCSICGTWTNGTLGGTKDAASGKFACHGCAAAYVQGLGR